MKGFPQLKTVLKSEQEIMSESVLQWFAEEREITLCTNPPALKVILEKGKEEQEKDEVLTVISYHCAENLLPKQSGRKATNKVLLIY